MRYLLPAGLCLAFAACAPTMPNDVASSRGVEGGSYTDYLRARELQAQTGAPASGTTAGAPLVGTQPLSDAAAAPTGTVIGSVIGGTTANSGVDPTVGLAADRPRGDAPATIRPESGELSVANDPKISDEQSFAAVSSRETIESDKERLAQQRAQYQVIPPTAVPSRPVEISPNIVEYALNSTNPIGTQIYHRGNPFRNSLSARACVRFPSADKAQEAFLANGGPERDPKSLDPDGDGYACSWDPAPFRMALQK